MKTLKSETFKIEKNIPIPPKGYGEGMTTFIRSMKVGDSFLIPKGKQVGNAFTGARFAGYKLTSRRQPDGTARVWRIA